MVGSLQLDGYEARGGMDGDGIDEEFVAVLLDLSEKSLVFLLLGQFRLRAQTPTEFVHSSLNGLNVGVHAVAIQAIGSGLGRDSHGIAQSVKHLRLSLNLSDRLLYNRF